MTDPALRPGSRVGILGGTFDPVHNGHLNLAEQIMAARELDGVLLTLSADHPLKADSLIASWDDRLTMLQLALNDKPNLSISTIEQEEGLSGYTIDTVRALKKRYPEVEFFFIVGADNLRELNNWRDPKGILTELKVLCGSRPGFELDLPDELCELSDRIELVETSLVDIASTELREALKSGADNELVRTMIPEPVVNYIKEKKLYQ